MPFKDHSPLCGGCRKELKPIGFLHCKRCGTPLPDGGAHCRACKGTQVLKYKCSIIRSALVYNEQSRALMHAYKYKGLKHLASYFAMAMAGVYAKEELFNGCDIIIAVPAAKKRLKERGFSQTHLLAEQLAKLTGLEHKTDVLIKIKHTKPQTGLKKEERLTNLENAFEVIDPAAVKGKTVLLTDDVATTGSTLEECAKTLKKAGAKRVKAITFLREPLKIK